MSGRGPETGDAQRRVIKAGSCQASSVAITWGCNVIVVDVVVEIEPMPMRQDGRIINNPNGP